MIESGLLVWAFERGNVSIFGRADILTRGVTLWLAVESCLEWVRRWGRKRVSLLTCEEIMSSSSYWRLRTFI